MINVQNNLIKMKKIYNKIVKVFNNKEKNMLSKIDLMHIYSLKDLQKMQHLGVSEKDLRQAYAILNEKKRRNAQSFKKESYFLVCYFG